jgi:PAS domain S-box-containing protein
LHVPVVSSADATSPSSSVGAGDLAERLLESSPDGVIGVDRRLRLTLWNPAMERLSGVSADDALGRPVGEICAFNQERAMEAAIAGHALVVRDRPYAIPATGRKGICDASYSPLRAPDGEIIGGLVFIRDVSERHQTELRMEETETRFRIMADSAPVMLWMAGLDAECDFFNQGWLRFTGRALADELGTRWAEGVHPEDFQRCMDVYFESFNQRRPFRMEYRLRRADGEYRWILDQGTPRYDHEGRFAGYIGSCIDVQDFKDAEQALLRANDELELRVHNRTEELRQSNGDLEQFAYAASHDLQEPLRTVASYVQLLSRRYQGKLDRDADDFIAYAVDGVTRMKHLIQDLLLYSRLTTRGEPPQATDCEEVLDRALANLRAAIEEAGAEVTHDPLPEVVADSSQLVRVFQNLIGNAIKFRGEQRARVHVGAERRDGDWLLSFRDNGIGIDPKYGDRVFAIFQRLHDRERYPGTGIGLAICRKVVERHGGRIWFESEPGQGSTFYVSLPVNE